MPPSFAPLCSCTNSVDLPIFRSTSGVPRGCPTKPNQSRQRLTITHALGIQHLTPGGAAGLDPEWLQTADTRLALSAMTLPHEIARLIVVEQIYRACTILRGEPYHKA